MNKAIKIIVSILLIINILVIGFLSCVAYYGKLAETHIKSDVTGSTSVNGINADVSFIDLLKMEFAPDSLDITNINRTAISNLSHDGSYTNHEYTVTIKNRSYYENGYWADIYVEEDGDLSHGYIVTMHGEERCAEYEFYLHTVNNCPTVYIEDDGTWFVAKLPDGVSTNYHITKIIDILPNVEYSSFPFKSTGQNWDFYIKDSFLRKVYTWQDGRIEYIESYFPANAGNRMIFNFVSDNNPHNLLFIYHDRGSAGNVKIDMPDFESQNLEHIPLDIFDKYKEETP